MEEVKIKNNPLGLKIYINGVPDISQIPKDLMDAFIGVLTEQVLSYISEKREKKNEE